MIEFPENRLLPMRCSREFFARLNAFDAISRCLGEVKLVDVTVGELRSMLEGLPDDEPLAAAVAVDGSFVVSPHLETLR